MLALHRALAAGRPVSALLAMFDESGERSRSHGLPAALLCSQAAALGIELVMRRAGWADYETVFVEQLRSFAEQGVGTVIFGDIDLREYRGWEEAVCARAGLRAELPLWQQPRRALVDELLQLGYRARVSCVDARWLDASFCGREFDEGLLADLPPGVDACGENGEFHTFVFDGPRFAQAVTHRLVAVHDLRVAPPAAGHYFVAEFAS